MHDLITKAMNFSAVECLDDALVLAFSERKLEFIS
jgi:hypothetical protein